MRRNVAYVFLYKNGIKERSVGIVKRYGTAEQPEVALELFGEEARKKWCICYLTKGESLCEATYLWGRTGSYGRSEVRVSQCRLCTEAGTGAGVVLLPMGTVLIGQRGSEEQAKLPQQTNPPEQTKVPSRAGCLSGFTRSDLREYLCARYDGQEMAEDMLWAAVCRKPVEAPENPCIESAKKLMEEITKVAGREGEKEEGQRERSERTGRDGDVGLQSRVGIEEKIKRRPRKQMTYLEELLFLKPPYMPCDRYDVEYSVRIAPEDLVSLPKKAHNYENNSYLLHSYYRYRHILLGRCRRNEKEDYVILVPGVYSGKEARVAELFGFPEFLPVALKKPETGRAASGKENFGYFCGKI